MALGGLLGSDGGSGGGGMWGGLMGGLLGGDIIAGAQTNNANSWQADHAMDRSDAMAREEMAFQERMSNSAYQRATADMKAAGINPMVAFQQGGASTPNGAMGQSSMAKMENPMSGTLASAMDAVRLKKDLSQADSGIALNQAQATKALADAQASGSSAKLSEKNSAVIDAQMNAIKAKANADAVKAGWDTKLGNYDAIAGRVNRDAGTASKLMNLIKIPDSFKKETFVDPKTGEILNP